MIGSPSEMLREVEKYRSKIDGSEFFNNNDNRWLRDAWIAAQFALSFEKAVEKCTVEIDENDEQELFDFRLHLSNGLFPVQAVEALDQGRRRGKEYKENHSPFDEEYFQRPAGNYNELIRASISHKLEKYRNISKDVNLLVRVNIFGFTCDYVELKENCMDISSGFKSVWIQSGRIFGAIYESEAPKFNSPTWYEC
jgi:hypothetical protein